MIITISMSLSLHVEMGNEFHKLMLVHVTGALCDYWPCISHNEIFKSMLCIDINYRCFRGMISLVAWLQTCLAESQTYLGDVVC